MRSLFGLLLSNERKTDKTMWNEMQEKKKEKSKTV